VRSIDASIVGKRLEVRFQWLRAHHGNAGNERADALAAHGAREAKAEIAAEGQPRPSGARANRRCFGAPTWRAHIDRSDSRRMSSRALRPLPLLLGLSALAACGGGGAGPGGGKLYDQTLAGQSKCASKGDARPFILDWDATDQSSFQAQSQNDVVFVHFEGCQLKVLYGCRDDSVKGSYGSYKPIEWTSGGVESIDIHDEGELYAKLPLGAVSLSGKLQGGEKLHMEYYVSGTRTATRDKIFRGDLAKNKACEGATHFVYQFNLGAFALATASSLKSEVNGSYFGFGAGGAKSSDVKTEKKGGELAACTDKASKEGDDCSWPIRLSLREIVAGESDATLASKAPETDAALNLAGQLKATTDAEKAAAEHLDTARLKKAAKDGKSCIAELDEHDKLDPRPGGLSTNPKAYASATLRGECLMLAGNCEGGKDLFRKAYATQYGTSAEETEKTTENFAIMDCQGGAGGKMSDRDQYIQALDELQRGAFETPKTAAVCDGHYATAMKFRKTVKQKDDSDWHVPKEPIGVLTNIAPGCLAKAGACDRAYKVYVELEEIKVKENIKPDAVAQVEKLTGQKKPMVMPTPGELKARFEASNPTCAKK
jgi:hypothetical protein